MHTSNFGQYPLVGPYILYQVYNMGCIFGITVQYRYLPYGRREDDNFYVSPCLVLSVWGGTPRSLAPNKHSLSDWCVRTYVRIVRQVLT
jgi:hypothetical protein